MLTGIRRLSRLDCPLLILESWPGKVYEPFAGAGTSLVAAEQLGCQAFGMELSPAYGAVILQRMKDLGLEPRLSDA